MYNENSAERLQKIIMLRFLDLSLEQIYEAMKKDDGDIRKSLEQQELHDYFTVLQVEEHENNLLVPDEGLICNYVSSYSKHAEEVTSRDKESFLKRVRSKMNAEGYFYIHKSTGVVVCEK